MRSILARVLMVPIRFYQRFISPGLPPTCRYYPSCSAYAVKALEVHGPVKGLILAVWRLLRCNPWSLGGVDHVPKVGRWKPEPYVRPPLDEFECESRDDASRELDGDCSSESDEDFGDKPSKVLGEKSSKVLQERPGSLANNSGGECAIRNH
ncbi:membrane protein insertion efficiency factor YidD [Gleimia hominis]|uniref:membrane protein insertion efficiency factor YidD n=1 Tax=Gleimia hominis TaxID=595468 RepID=UPI0028A7A300|nr:membrane protein insertion efficiency factor YidD [Gleimia hominis]